MSIFPSITINVSDDLILLSASFSHLSWAKDLIPMLAEMIAWSAKYDPQTGVPSGTKKLIKKDKEAFIQSLGYKKN